MRKVTTAQAKRDYSIGFLNKFRIERVPLESGWLIVLGEGLAEGFTKKYGVKTLVWYEQHATMESAIAREKALKKWNRAWKLKLIEQTNPQWRDLWPEINGETEP